MSESRASGLLETLFGKRTLLLGWLGALVLSFGWLHALWVYVPASGGALWFATGIVLLVVGCRGGDPGPRRLRASESVLLGVASMAGFIFLPYPFDLGPAVLFVCALLALPIVPAWVRHTLLPGLWIAGVVLTVQAGLLPGMFGVAARLHEAPLLTPLLYAPLKILAPDTIRTGTTLQMVTTVGSVPLTPSWEKVAIIPAVLMAVAFVTLTLSHRRGLSRLASLFLLALGYAWVRLIVLFLVVSRYHDPRVFWHPAALFVGFLPFVLVVAAWWRQGAGPDAGSAHDTDHDIRKAGAWSNGWAALGALLMVAGITAHRGYQDPGSPKPGRVLIDESHCDWEWTTQPFDTAWYGAKSGYNYYCLADYWNHFYHVETHRDPLTPAWLSRWDVVVVKTPTSAYTPAEIDALVEFVRRGGGLFLIGDHTNVFGSSTYLNPIAQRFKLYFRYDATYRLDNLDLSLWRPPAVLPHAVVRNMDDFLFATSCSLDSPMLSENVILGYGLRSIYLDYSETSYFPSKEDKVDDLYPILQQAGGVRFGRGRVLAFTDSTVFSNFFMFIPGKPELALGSIDWLNRTNRHGALLWLALIVALGGFLVLLWALVRGSWIDHATTAVGVGLLVFVGVAGLCRSRAAQDYRLPQPVRLLREVVFDAGHGSFLLPVQRLLTDQWNNAHTFYVWMQRVGLVPRVEQDLETALQPPPSVLVEMNPTKEFTLTAIDSLAEYVRKGGALFVLDTPLNTGSQSNQLLGAFSMSFVAQREDSVAVLHPQGSAGEWLTGSSPGDTLAIAVKAYGVQGAQTLLVLPNGTPVLATRDFGRGRVIACGASQLFSTGALGSTAVTPTTRMRSLYQVQFDLLDRVMGIQVTDRYALRPTHPTTDTNP